LARLAVVCALVSGGFPCEAYAQTGTAPRIENSLVDRTIVTGQAANFVVTAVGSSPISFQWQRLLPGAAAWTNLTFETDSIYSGANTQTLTLNYTALAMNGEQFRCVATNSFGTSTSNAATLRVSQSLQQPTIVSQPASQTVTAGFSTIFSVVAIGAPSPTYQWYRASNPIAGATAASFRIVNVQAEDSGSYSVEVTNGAGSVVSSVVSLIVVPAVASIGNYPLTTIAGQPGLNGAVNALGTAARFDSPGGLAVDPSGNLYVADEGNHLIRKITSTGTVTTLAGLTGNGGSNDGPATAARFLYPKGVAVDGAGTVYVADSFNHTVRKVTQAGVVTTFAGQAGSTGALDGVGPAARFNTPQGIAVDQAGNVYVTDRENQLVRKISPAGAVSTLAGLAGSSGSADGTGNAARFYGPSGIAVDVDGNVYVVDTFNQTIRKITATGVVSTLAGSPGATGSADGAAANARFLYPNGIAADLAGNLYIADTSNSILRKLNPSGFVSTIAGQAGNRGAVDGTGLAARLHTPFGIAVSSGGDLFATDILSFTVRKGTLTSPPQIGVHPKNQSVVSGTPVTFTVRAIGSGLLGYQWQRLAAGQAVWSNLLSGAGTTGANTAMLNLSDPTTAMNGDRYRCAVANSLGAETSNPATLSVAVLAVAPAILTAPLNQATIAGQMARFDVTASGTAPLVYRWFIQTNETLWTDLAVDVSNRYSGASTSSLSVNSVALSQHNSRYRCVVTNAAGSATSESASLAVTAVPSRLGNISVRGRAGSGGRTLILGFAASGEGNKQLMLRVVGPTLGVLGVPDTLSDPRMALYSATPDMRLGQNDDWGGAPALANAMAQVGAFTLPIDSKDAALQASLPPGGYSVHASGHDSSTGVVLIEAYDADGPATRSRLSNVSARNFVGAGGDILILGFSVRGDTPRTFLFRGVGPTLVAFGVADTLFDPKLRLIGEVGTLLVENDNWGGAAAISEASAKTGAFPLDASTRDAAILATLLPGNYSLHVVGNLETTGVALAEIYEVP